MKPKQIKVIASVFGWDNTRVGRIVTIQRTKTFLKIPYKWYFQFFFVPAKNIKEIPDSLVKFFDGTAAGEQKLKDALNTQYPNCKIVDQSIVDPIELTLDFIEPLL